jgi:hypothetical protein
LPNGCKEVNVSIAGIFLFPAFLFFFACYAPDFGILTVNVMESTSNEALVCKLRYFAMPWRSLKALGGFPPAILGVNDGG